MPTGNQTGRTPPCLPEEAYHLVETENEQRTSKYAVAKYAECKDRNKQGDGAENEGGQVSERASQSR